MNKGQLSSSCPSYSRPALLWQCETSFPRVAYSFAKQTTVPSYSGGHGQKVYSLCFSSGKSCSGRRPIHLFITNSPFLLLVIVC